ncbi:MULTISPECIES: acyl-CoA desaturase [Micromonospora]|uniref:Stearoyl-CoA 9-desaturase n=1 Tax=Micromonospora saelicesensis TaxID=285676 RepID=A0A1C4UEJ9_9ACTN|nr:MULTISPECIES: acyl-CoA desaturase [Micromonospora]MBM0206699.1 acyl-CoA desaturase [Micromonospora sp. STR1s_5]RAN98890.1 Stearoyl-CoA 9-desaturase [Micromonospora saelicesensis]RAO38437.1 Stearoyl-CoA 9-desaturase [Micromonospora saelicesensis]RAO41773.1 Stearoyl-CoA 9-desaturase [Micromonospora saelicesensis]RAO47362.1 Stearoyl-CoA 9-desaturase [Micromonospora saelicesensis]
MSTALLDSNTAGPGPKPLTDGSQSPGILAALWAFVVIPFVALLVAVPVAWGGWLGWTDVIIGLVWYVVSGLGITVGFHRYFTHGSFKAKRWLRVTLAVAGSLAVQGEIIQWVADHRRHHAFSDLEGDPHSPWRFGTSFWALTRGLFHAHVGWLFRRELSNRGRFAPDLIADRDISRVDRLFPALVAISLLGPALIGGLVTWSWQGALTAFFWAGLVRIGLLHHVTWAINSVCHVYGERPFAMRQGDRASNFWPLAILSFGESWHNLHHADPTSARHGVLRGQVDISARVIWLFEKTGAATQVRWPKPERLAAKLVKPVAPR